MTWKLIKLILSTICVAGKPESTAFVVCCCYEHFNQEAVEPITKEENNNHMEQHILQARLLFWKDAY
jgi:hypothetical protein